jgi:hypothetical protein
MSTRGLLPPASIALWLAALGLLAFLVVPLVGLILGAEWLILWLNVRVFPFVFVTYPRQFNTFEPPKHLVNDPVLPTLAHWIALGLLAFFIHRRGVKSTGLSATAALAISIAITAAAMYVFKLEVSWWKT